MRASEQIVLSCTALLERGQSATRAAQKARSDLAFWNSGHDVPKLWAEAKKLGI
jgi:hypothetical protein